MNKGFHLMVKALFSAAKMSYAIYDRNFFRCRGRFDVPLAQGFGMQ